MITVCFWLRRHYCSSSSSSGGWLFQSTVHTFLVLIELKRARRHGNPQFKMRCLHGVVCFELTCNIAHCKSTRNSKVIFPTMVNGRLISITSMCSNRVEQVLTCCSWMPGVTYCDFNGWMLQHHQLSNLFKSPHHRRKKTCKATICLPDLVQNQKKTIIQILQKVICIRLRPDTVLKATDTKKKTKKKNKTTKHAKRRQIFIGPGGLYATFRRYVGLAEWLHMKPDASYGFNHSNISFKWFQSIWVNPSFLFLPIGGGQNAGLTSSSSCFGGLYSKKSAGRPLFDRTANGRSSRAKTHPDNKHCQ